MTMRASEKIVATYHSDCNDGTTAVAILLKKHPTATVFGLSHDARETEEKELQPILNILDSKTTLYTLDNAIGIKQFVAHSGSTVTIDHHLSIKADLEELAKSSSNFKYIFDNSHSGAMLSWNFFYKNKIPPDIVKYVEDADLWQWRFGETTKQLSHWAMLRQNLPLEIIPYLTTKKNVLAKVIKEGAIMAEFSQFEIDSFLQKALPLYISINNYKVPAYNLAGSQFQSSYIGNKLSEHRNQTVALFSIVGNDVRLSFRSCSDVSPTSSELARHLQGGGHTRSSGAHVSLNNFLKMISAEKTAE